MGVDAKTDPERALSRPGRAPLLEAGLFLAVGGSATLLNMIFYVGLVHLAGILPTYAAALSFALVVPFHFLSYARIVFPPERVDRALLVRYVAALALSFALNVGLVGFYWGFMGAQPIPAQVLGLIPAILANYLTFKFFVFRPAIVGLPQLSAATSLNLATAGVSGATTYVAIAAMLIAAGPAPPPEAAAALKSEALRDILDLSGSLPQLLPGVLIKLNAILSGSAPSILIILVTGMIGLAGLLLAYASDRALVRNDAPASQRLAAGLTVLAGVMVLHIATADADTSGGLAHGLIVLGATGAALASSGLIGRLLQPETAVVFCNCALIAMLSGTVGVLVWLMAPVGLVLTRWARSKGGAPPFSFHVLLGAFAIAAGLIAGTTTYWALLFATLIAAAILALDNLRVASSAGQRNAAAIATLCLAVTLSAVAYGAIVWT
ncbi:MAG: GtrA family protein [Alphaproteobacteria bacterium]|nr:GtrA family protein [Alphaproteobacteria bacterium]